MQDPEVLKEFKLEADEMLNESEDFLLSMEKGDNFVENFNGIFRAFHSLKGAAGMFEIDTLQSFMHTIETQFESLRNQDPFLQWQIDYFLRAIDSARSILEGGQVDLDLTEFDREGQSAEQSNVQSNKETNEVVEVKEKVEEIKEKVQERTIEKKKSLGLIYVVDDEEFICINLKEILKSFDYQVETFTNPMEAVATIRQTPPDLICTDLKMPQMTGMQLLQILNKYGIKVPVIFITAFIDNKLLTEGLSCGASGFLEKPFEEHQVISLIKMATEKAQSRKLLNRSINLLLYQFNELDNYLENQGKETLRRSLKLELQALLKLKKEMA